MRSLFNWGMVIFGLAQPLKNDQPILGESDFVSDVLSESEEQFSRKYKLKNLGYDFEKVIERISILFQVEKDYITGRGRRVSEKPDLRKRH